MNNQTLMPKADLISCRETFWAMVIFMVAAFCLFANTFHGTWVYDDFPVIVNNPDIRTLRGFFANSIPGRPLREVTFLLDYALFGLDPAGWHIQNIFWHALNAFLTFCLAVRLTRSRAVAWTASLLFLVHPIQVEVVANTSHRKDSLSLAFCLLSVLAYSKAFENSRTRLKWGGISMLLAFLAVMAKENALVLPLVFYVYEVALVSKERQCLGLFKRCWLAGLVFATAVALFAWRFFAAGGALTTLSASLLNKMNHLHGTLQDYYLMVLKSWSFMFFKLVWPADLAVEYVYAVPQGWLNSYVVSALVLIGTGSAAAWVFWRKSPQSFFALSWAVLFFLPISNVWPLSYFAADRYLYASSVGICLLFSIWFCRIFQNVPHWRTAVVVALTVVLAFQAFKQAQVWRDSMNLWSQAVKVNPASSSALTQLGMAYLDAGETSRAIELFTQAALKFNWPPSYYYLGRAYEAQGNGTMALRYYCRFLHSKGPKMGIEPEGLRKYLLERYGTDCG